MVSDTSLYQWFGKICQSQLKNSSKDIFFGTCAKMLKKLPRKTNPLHTVLDDSKSS